MAISSPSTTKIDSSKILERAFQRLQAVAFAEVALKEGDAVYGIHRQEIDGHDTRLRAQPGMQHLRPAAGRGPQIHNAHALPEEVVLVGELEQLERCPRPIAKPRCLLDPVVVDVLIDPSLDELVLAG